MNFDESLRSVGTILSERPADVLPVYLLGTAVAVIGQSIAFVGLALAYLSLLGTGRLAAVATAFDRLDVNPAAGTPEEMFDPGTMEPLADAIAGLFTPTVVAIAALTLVAALAAYLFVRALTAAASIHASAAAIRDEFGTVAGVAGADRDWKRFVLLEVVRTIALWTPTAVLGLLALLSAPALVLVLGVLVWLPATLVAALAFLFVPQAIAIDDVGLVEGIRRNFGFVRRNVVRTIAYVVFLLGSGVGIAVLAALLGVLGVNSVTGLVVWFVVTPVTGVLKTGLYLDEPPAARHAADGYGGAFLGAFGRGLHALRAFVVGRIGYVAAMLGVFALSTAGGWLATRRYAVDAGGMAGLDPASVFGAFPLDTFFNLMANNWQVSIGIAYAGLGFGIPSVVNMAFNGVIVGALGGIFDDPVLFAAFIAPHGIVEIPALAVAGGFGLHLGRVAWGYVRGRRTAGDLAAEIQGTYYALLGLLPLFVVAAFIEAFVTPYVAAYFV